MFDWVTGFVESGGYLAVLLLMILENVIPPIPSEVIMPLAGFAAERGELNIFLVILTGALGSVIGATFWYVVGRWFGLERIKHLAARHGRLMTISPADVDKARHWFDRHGGKAILIGRVLPTVRTLISVPAGIVAMPVPVFLLYTTIGTLVWMSLLAGAGYAIGTQYEQVEGWVNPVSNLVVVAIVASYLYRVWRFRPEDD